MIVERYVERTPGSRARAEEAARWLPGGDTRTITWFGPHPLFVEEGHGFELVDVDGNRYLDLLSNYTSLIHGHAHPAIVEAIERRVDSLDRVRFCNSGTEAVMNAVRLARAYTGRPLLAKVEGGYHGSWDGVEVSIEPPLESAGPPERPTAWAETAGLAPGSLESVVVLPFNDLTAAEAILEEAGGRLAAVIVEPVAGVAGTVPADAEYLHGLRAATQRLGALLILDEVISLRLAPGGAQQLYGVRPDLTTMGKIVGGGLPVGAFGGREDVMALTDPRRTGGISQSGTFNGNPLTMAAGVAALELLTPGEYERLNGLGDRLRRDVEALGVVATGLGSLLTVQLTGGPVENYRDGRRADPEATRLFHLALLNEGVFAARRGLMCISTPMGEREVDGAAEAIGRALEAVRAELPLAAGAPAATV